MFFFSSCNSIVLNYEIPPINEVSIKIMQFLTLCPLLAYRTNSSMSLNVICIDLECPRYFIIGSPMTNSTIHLINKRREAMTYSASDYKAIYL